MSQTGLCSSTAKQAAFPEKQKKQCHLASSGEKCTLSGNLGEFHVLMLSSIVRQVFKYKHNYFYFYFCTV